MTTYNNGARQIDVQVQLGANGKPVVSCSPETIELDGDLRGVVLIFVLRQTGTTNWAFPTERVSDDDFYGIKISNDTEGEFFSSFRPSDDLVFVWDGNTNNKKYEYSITVKNTQTQETLYHDPTIENRNDG